jgi:poly(3-hydroxyoctanoate) depolymerase
VRLVEERTAVSSEPLDTTLALTDHRVQVRVSGYGPPLLLLNGVGAPLELWDPLLRQLPGIRTISFDTPGSGGSPAPGVPLSIPGHARLAAQVLDRLGFAEVSVLGLSFGGMVAQELAHVAGRRVQRIVLCSTSCGWGGVPGSPDALLSISTPERYYSRELSRPRSSVRPARRGYLYQFWAAATWSSLPWLWQVNQPALVVTGDQDPLVPPVNAQILAALLPKARLHVVPGGGHLCVLDRAAEVGPRLLEFLG